MCLFEAWATQTPFIAIENQGISELVTISNKHIFFSEKENVFMLKDKIKYFIDNKFEMVFNSNLYIHNTIKSLIKKINKLAL